MRAPTISYKRHRFASQIVAHAVWLYDRFNLSLRAVEEILLERGIDVSYESIRRWILMFRPPIVPNLRHRQASSGDVWHLDGVVLEEILRSRGDKRMAKRLLIKHHGFVPKRIVSDRLRAYSAAKHEVASGLGNWSRKGWNIRAETSYLPPRRRERTVRGAGHRVGCKASSASTQQPAVDFQPHPIVARP